MPVVSESEKNLIADNWASVQDQVAAASEKSGRSVEDITIVGVSKYVDANYTRALFESGCEHLGESRPQKLWDKADALADVPVRWHMIGHLQRNKVRRTLPIAECLHSIDSKRLANAVSEAACELQSDSPQKCLIEVNISGDQDKHGFHPDEVEAAVVALSSLAGLQICGFMCMASLAGSVEDARKDFQGMRELRDSVAASLGEAYDLRELSMGMSRDFPQAIEEGATIVRVGSRLFDGIER